MKLEGRKCNKCHSVVFVGHATDAIINMTLCPVCGSQELKLMDKTITIPDGEEERDGK